MIQIEAIRGFFPPEIRNDSLFDRYILKEYIQLSILDYLSATLFIRKIVLIGGTNLRLVRGIDRFSEDLDFFLKRPDPDFQWQRYLDPIIQDGAGEGFHFNVLDKSRGEAAVKKTFLRTDSIGRVLLLELPFDRNTNKLIKVKLEIDTNLPMGPGYETRHVTFFRNISSDDLKAHSKPFRLGPAVEVHVPLIKLMP